MPVESATKISELNKNWPLGTDARSEGDDHIRLIKSVLLSTAGFVKFTSIAATSTTFQYQTDTLYALVEVWGAGGGGGQSSGTPAAGSSGGGGGGGAGGYAAKFIVLTQAIRDATKTITVAGTTPQNSNGGNTSYADTVNTLTGNGGTAGVGGGVTTSLTIRGGGAGGTASGGDINLQGDQGENGIAFGSTQCGASTSAGKAGNGASAVLGGSGGIGSQVSASSGSVSMAGTGAPTRGAGGGGSIICNTGSHSNAGAGGAGAVSITEFR